MSIATTRDMRVAAARHIRLPIPALAAALALAACTGEQGPPLVSATSPPSTYAQSANSEPQPLTSLPPGAANISAAPNAVVPNTGSITLRAF